MNRLTASPVVDGDRLLVTTAELGQLVLRPVGPADDWLVFGSEHGAMSAWEAVQRGLS